MRGAIDGEGALKTVERVLNKVLLGSMVVAVLFIIVGLSIYLISGQLEVTEQATVDEMIEYISSSSAEGLLAIAMIIIVATPIIRLLTAAAVFSLKRDIILAVISISVLAIIALGFYLKVA